MNRSSRICLAITAAGFCAAAAAQQAPAPPAPTAPPLSRGATLYVRVGCIQCHGGVGQGGSEAPPVVATSLDYDSFARQVREPVDKMPPYTRKVLSDADLRAIYDHVLTMRP